MQQRGEGELDDNERFRSVDHAGRGGHGQDDQGGHLPSHFTCIQQFVNQIRVNQNDNYNDFIKYVNDHGGVAGRTIVPTPVLLPHPERPALALCTKFTEDDHVFAVMGNFVDFSGDAQTCLAKDTTPFSSPSSCRRRS